MEDAVDPREPSHDIPVLEIALFILRVGDVVEDERVGGVEFIQQLAHLLWLPVHAEIP